ncbi:MAG: hypothetical protein COB35_01915 [Gammaproteobacteria bacterium]|nr:MAG: hypothetical protein COB35_01915 [Gammaproteobacteria bacterium]
MKGKLFRSLRWNLLIWTFSFALIPTYFLSNYLINEFKLIQVNEQIEKLKLQNANISQSVEFELKLLNSSLQQASLDADLVLSAYTAAFGNKARFKLNQLTANHSMLSSVILIDNSNWIAAASPNKAELINIESLAKLLNNLSKNNRENFLITVLNSPNLNHELREKGMALPIKNKSKLLAQSDHVLVYIYPLIFTASRHIDTGYLVGLVSIERIYQHWQHKLKNSQLISLDLNQSKIINIEQKHNTDNIQIQETLNIFQSSNKQKNKSIVIQAKVVKDKNLALSKVNSFIHHFQIITAAIIIIILLLNTFIISKLISLFNTLAITIEKYASGDLTPQRPKLFFTEINQIITVLAKMAERILQNQQELENRVEQRTNELQTTYDDLYRSNNQLKIMQTQLIEAEKMSQLGQLVAGVAHEINTPIGISVTATTALMDKVKQLEEYIENGKIAKSTLNNNLNNIHDCSHLIFSNLKRAAELIQNFKEVAVDQSTENQRKFNLYSYIQEVVNSLKPELKYYCVDIKTVGDKSLILDSDPGAFGQILTNLMMNSLKHAFTKQQAHAILIYFTVNDQQLTLTYQDDGCGIEQTELERIFEPFYTTKRGEGGTGLGLHIVYNLITQRLKGTIKCTSKQGQGVLFEINIPINDQ